MSHGPVGGLHILLLTSPEWFVLDDFNLDGAIDRAWADNIQGDLRCRLGDGSGGFGAPIDSPLMPHINVNSILRSGDLTHDGVPGVSPGSPSRANRVHLNPGVQGTGEGQPSLVLVKKAGLRVSLVPGDELSPGVHFSHLSLERSV